MRRPRARALTLRFSGKSLSCARLIRMKETSTRRCWTSTCVRWMRLPRGRWLKRPEPPSALLACTELSWWSEYLHDSSRNLVIHVNVQLRGGEMARPHQSA